MAIFFAVSQIIGGTVIAFLMNVTPYAEDVYYQYAIAVTGVTGLVTMIPAVWFYKRDRNRRVWGRLISDPPGVKMKGHEAVRLLALGAGLSLYINLVVGFLQMFMENNTYQDLMDKITVGHSIWEMILWMGIVAPIAEEMIFRWLIYLRLRDFMKIPAAVLISSVIFGVYHGNIVQAIYAGIVGAAMAYILEMSGNIWSCVFIHMGANIFSVILSEVSLKLLELQGTSYGVAANLGILIMYALLLAAVLNGIFYFVKKGHKRGYRAV